MAGVTRLRVRAADLALDDYLVGSGRRVTHSPRRLADGRVRVRVYNPLSDSHRCIDMRRDTTVTVERP